jgi:hypothetical protein
MKGVLGYVPSLYTHIHFLLLVILYFLRHEETPYIILYVFPMLFQIYTVQLYSPVLWTLVEHKAPMSHQRYSLGSGLAQCRWIALSKDMCRVDSLTPFTQQQVHHMDTPPDLVLSPVVLLLLLLTSFPPADPPHGLPPVLSLVPWVSMLLLPSSPL